MNAKPLPSRCTAARPGNPQAEAVFAGLGTIPLAILVIEAVIGFILVLLSVLFFATIYFAFVGFILIYVALWIAVVLNGLGAAVSLVTLIAGWRQRTGKVLGVSGLLIHLILLGAVSFGLANIHSFLANLQKLPVMARREPRPPTDDSSRRHCLAASVWCDRMKAYLHPTQLALNPCCGGEHG